MQKAISSHLYLMPVRDLVHTNGDETKVSLPLTRWSCNALAESPQRYKLLRSKTSRGRQLCIQICHKGHANGQAYSKVCMKQDPGWQADTNDLLNA